MGKLARFIESIADAVKALVRDDDDETVSRIEAPYMSAHGAPPAPELTRLRQPLPMKSEPTRDGKPAEIKPGERRIVIARPQVVAFRPEAFAMERGQPERWRVYDIRVGNRSQLVQASNVGIPGDIFFAAIGELVLETVQTAMDLVLDVEYVGPEEAGEVFECTCMGSVAG